MWQPLAVAGIGAGLARERAFAGPACPYPRQRKQHRRLGRSGGSTVPCSSPDPRYGSTLPGRLPLSRANRVTEGPDADASAAAAVFAAKATASRCKATPKGILKGDRSLAELVDRPAAVGGGGGGAQAKGSLRRAASVGAASSSAAPCGSSPAGAFAAVGGRGYSLLHRVQAWNSGCSRSPSKTQLSEAAAEGSPGGGCLGPEGASAARALAEVIAQDRIFGGLLAEIKEAYESFLSERGGAVHSDPILKPRPVEVAAAEPLVTETELALEAARRAWHCDADGQADQQDVLERENAALRAFIKRLRSEEAEDRSAQEAKARPLSAAAAAAAAASSSKSKTATAATLLPGASVARPAAAGKSFSGEAVVEKLVGEADDDDCQAPPSEPATPGGMQAWVSREAARAFQQMGSRKLPRPMSVPELNISAL
eukprot:TRINITY_DN10788_c0_g1_i2.p1 TRINITY_DN10788_c0_g1~~TRINITY_DN10788_c0_g1_i2.p1  ORF type:complete len:427 (-),score=106.81 TRINITY_DN10788_c0_g1_i2:42-1322(-)